jgi:hypothetical protein
MGIFGAKAKSKKREGLYAIDARKRWLSMKLEEIIENKIYKDIFKIGDVVFSCFDENTSYKIKNISKIGGKMVFQFFDDCRHHWTSCFYKK